jgi:hypothetical protein
VTLVPAGSHRVTGWRIEDPADFYRNLRDDFDAEVYRKRTGVSGLGKSAGKELALQAMLAARLRLDL